MLGVGETTSWGGGEGEDGHRRRGRASRAEQGVGALGDRPSRALAAVGIHPKHPGLPSWRWCGCHSGNGFVECPFLNPGWHTPLTLSQKRLYWGLKDQGYMRDMEVDTGEVLGCNLVVLSSPKENKGIASRMPVACFLLRILRMPTHLYI